MPAGSEDRAPTVPLPHTFRPMGARIAVFGFGGLLVLVTVVIWFAFPPSIRAKFTPFQIGTVIFLGLGFGALGWGLAAAVGAHRHRGVVRLDQGGAAGQRHRDVEIASRRDALRALTLCQDSVPSRATTTSRSTSPSCALVTSAETSML